LIYDVTQFLGQSLDLFVSQQQNLEGEKGNGRIETTNLKQQT
jgi:hypothetical protein